MLLSRSPEATTATWPHFCPDRSPSPQPLDASVLSRERNRPRDPAKIAFAPATLLAKAFSSATLVAAAAKFRKAASRRPRPRFPRSSR